MNTAIVVAAAANEVIGRAGSLPWHLPADLRRFKSLTTGHSLVMGRRTYESILDRLGTPLKERFSVVISGATPNFRPPEKVAFRTSLASALETAYAMEESLGGSEVFVIGGGSVYQQALPYVNRVYLTRIHATIDGDCRLPGDWLTGFRAISQEYRIDQGTGMAYSFIDYIREEA